MLSRKCWVGTLSPSNTVPRVRMGQWNCTAEEGRKMLWSPWWLHAPLWIPGSGGMAFSFKRLHLETVLLHDRNAFVGADIRQIYETEMACSSPPPWNVLNVSLHRGCAFVYNYFFFCILILFSFLWMHRNYIFFQWVQGANCHWYTMAWLYETRKEKAPVLGRFQAVGWQLWVLIHTCATATL